MSAALLAMAIEKTGCPVVSLSSWQIQIHTNSSHGNARIKSIDADRVSAELARKIGLQPVTIASGANKVMLNPLEPVNPEHVKILERPVKQLHERFVEIVAKGRALPVEKVCEIADGRVLSASDALECGLVDGIGQVADARDQRVKLAGGEVRICAYRDKSDFCSLFGDTLMLESAGRILRKAEAAMDGDSAPRAVYRLR